MTDNEGDSRPQFERAAQAAFATPEPREAFPGENRIVAKMKLAAQMPTVPMPFDREDYEQIGFVEDALTADDLDDVWDDTPLIAHAALMRSDFALAAAMRPEAANA
jgi:hypothetical protein